ncbi:MAG: PilT/PilU family type 4a pilus ATPase [Candidatus Metalachnospira sp.]|nr:PilT/PilU family type 4a pilus ATPase [Candidatus Metalachnospira sp.]
MRIEDIVLLAKENNASDIHLIYNLPPKFRIVGELCSLTDYVLTDEDCVDLAIQLAGEELYNKFMEIGECDLAKTLCNTRIRVNIFRQMDHTSIALRLLNESIPILEALGLPPSVSTLTELKRGIVIVTGQTGSGKSTTLAAILDCINHTRRTHIITLEDPIEYIYKPDISIISQREIGRDTKSYDSGLYAALREDPDVILIGEIRNPATIEIALTAAETGHLVFTTLHTGSAADSIDRIVDTFSDAKQRQIRMQLSMTLVAVISQQLLPKKDCSGRVLAYELMFVNSAIRNLIREGKTPQIDNVIATTAESGSVTMDNTLLKLVREKKISAETARLSARNQDYIRKNIGR